MSALWLLASLVSQVVFSFADPAINESSGLVDLGATMVTTNDSGGDPLVFSVDPRTGETVGRTTFTDAVEDVEALAPAGAGEVWVADIGDNAERRESVQVYRVPVGRGDTTVAAPSYELVYPDGARDAESLVASRNGRLYVIGKGLLGGTVYVAPRRLDPDAPNVLRPVAAVDVWATDAALFPDGRHVLVRGYDNAAVYTFPDFEPVGSFDLPPQDQGEGVSIGRSGRIRISSEGAHSDVVQVELPGELRSALEAEPPTPSAAPEPAVGTDDVAEVDDEHSKWLVVGGTLAALVAIAVWVSRRRES